MGYIINAGREENVSIRSDFTRNIVLITILMLLCFLTLSCGSDSPDIVTTKFALALFKENDTSKAESYCTEKFLREDFELQKTMSTLMGDALSGEKAGSVKQEAKELTWVIEDDGKAHVWYQDDRSMEYILAKEDGKWKIDGFQVNFLDDF